MTVDMDMVVGMAMDTVPIMAVDGAMAGESDCNISLERPPVIDKPPSFLSSCVKSHPDMVSGIELRLFHIVQCRVLKP